MRILLILYMMLLSGSVFASSFVNISEVISRHGFKVKKDLHSSSIRLVSSNNTVIIAPNSNGVLVDGVYHDLGSAVHYRSGKLLIPASFVSFLPWPVKIIAKPKVVLKSPVILDGAFKVVLDPGHGGKDPGARSKSGVREKDVVLSVAIKVGEILKNNPNIKVYFTRKTDVFIPLPGRGLVANNVGADIFISIHANASSNTNATGADFYYVSPTYDDWERSGEMDKRYDLRKRFAYEMDSPLNLYERRIYHLLTQHHRIMGMDLARFMQRSFNNDVGCVTHRIKKARFHVLRMSPCPSVLVETGFLTNPEEAILLNTDSYRNKLARAIADGIIAASKRWRK